MTDDETEETVMVTRRDRRRAGRGPDGAQEQAPSVADDATVVVDRAKAAPPVAADERDAPDERESADDATVVVSRPLRRLRRKRLEAAGPDDPEGEGAAGPRSVESFAAPTDGETPSIYKPRPAPVTPVAPPVVAGAAAPTRLADPELVSVEKQARRWSLIALSTAASMCVVSVAGLVALGFVVLS